MLRASATLTRYVGATHPVWVMIAASCGAPAVSPTVWLSLMPAITMQPRPAYLSAGSRANFEVTASGAWLSYRWYSGNTTLGSQHALTTPAVTADLAVYAEVTSGSAAVASMAGQAQVCAGPSITSATVSGGGNCKQLAVYVADMGNVCYYEWWKGPVGDTASSQLVETGQNYSISACSVPVQTTYWVRVYGYDLERGNPNDNWTCYTDSTAMVVNP